MTTMDDAPKLATSSDRELLALSAVFDHALDGTAVVDDDRRYVDVNRAGCALLGLTRDELVGQQVGTFVDSNVASMIPGLWEDFLRKGESRGEFLFRKPDGRLLLVEFEARRNIVPGRHLVTFRDITDSRKLEETLRDAERQAVDQYEALIERLEHLAQSLGTAHDLEAVFQRLRDFAVAATKSDGIFVMLYDAERERFQPAYVWGDNEEPNVAGLPSIPLGNGPNSQAVRTLQTIVTNDYYAAMQGHPFVIVGPDPRRPQSSLVAPMCVMGRVVGTVQVQSYEPNAYAQGHMTAMRMAANLSAVAIENVRMVERDHQREKELRQSQKMEAIGRLAGGVAHDFNNLLTVIAGYSDFALCRTQDDSLRRDLLEVKYAGERAAMLTRQLLAFSRKQLLQPKPVNLNVTVAEIGRMLRRLIGAHIELELSLEPALGRVMADPGQMEQIIMNFVVNARDAMLDGGKLKIQTANVERRSADSPDRAMTHPDGYVSVAVSDTGCGMDDQTKARIFEPFFTTKEEGKGTGLGLSTVYGIVQQSDGSMEVDTEPGHGTTFTVYLPRLGRELDEIDNPHRLDDVRGGSETILLVEDDEKVRMLAVETLKRQGYTVFATSQAEEALVLADRHGQALDLVATDVVMPRMNGCSLAQALLSKNPNLRILYMSGYTEDEIIRHGVSADGISFIAKPFTPDGLARKVRDVLDGR